LSIASFISRITDESLRNSIRRYCSVFFQAEDGIRDRNVTGVQTCALPISRPLWRKISKTCSTLSEALTVWQWPISRRWSIAPSRSEERRVGKEGRSRWSLDN